jgi:hypothetical protein
MTRFTSLAHPRPNWFSRAARHLLLIGGSSPNRVEELNNYSGRKTRAFAKILLIIVGDIFD